MTRTTSEPVTLTGDDLICLSAYVARDLATLGRTATFEADFNRLARGAPSSIGYTPLDLSVAAVDELADLISSAILDHNATMPRRCHCPGDCNCRHTGPPFHRVNYCGCQCSDLSRVFDGAAWVQA